MHLSWVFIAHLVPHVQLLVPWGFFLDFRERYAWNGTHDDNEFSTSKWSYKVYQWWYVVVAGDNSALVGHSGSILAAIDLLDPGFRGPKQQAKKITATKNTWFAHVQMAHCMSHVHHFSLFTLIFTTQYGLRTAFFWRNPFGLGELPSLKLTSSLPLKINSLEDEISWNGQTFRKQLRIILVLLYVFLR